MEIPETRTSATLIWSVRLGDATAWEAFVLYYRPWVVAWCRRWHAQPAEAEDVAQIVLLKLVSKMRDIEYDPHRSFRKLLKTVTRNAWVDYLRARNQAGQGSGRTDFWITVDGDAAVEDLEQTIEHAWRRELFDRAAAKVKMEVSEISWKCFDWIAVQGKAAAELAESLGMKVGAVVTAKYRVSKMIRAEIDELIAASPDG